MIHSSKSSASLQVLTDRRISQLSGKPLQATEFIAPLARMDPVYKEEEEAFKVNRTRFQDNQFFHIGGSKARELPTMCPNSFCFDIQICMYIGSCPPPHLTRLAPPPTVNPGSATVSLKKFFSLDILDIILAQALVVAMHIVK